MSKIKSQEIILSAHTHTWVQPPPTRTHVYTKIYKQLK